MQISLSGFILLMVWSAIIIGSFIAVQAANMKLKEENSNLKIKVRILKTDLASAKYAAEFWETRFQYHNRATSNTNLKNNKDLVDAVKRGMMAAHPDKGGNQNDFIRFHKVYKELMK